MRTATIVLLSVLGLVAVAAAQEPAPARAPSEQEAASQPALAVPAASQPAPLFDETGVALPTRDLFDVVRDWRHKPPPPPPGRDDYKKWMVAAAPVVSYSPTTGFGIGAAGNMAVYQGFPNTTRISSIVASATATTKSQVLVNAKINATTRENRRNFLSDNRLYWTSQKTYGLGTDSPEDAAVDQKYDYFRFFETLFWRVVPNTYLGAGFLYSNHRNIRPADEAAEAAWGTSPYVTYSEQNGFDLESQTSAGLTLNLLVDSRDGAINPSRGWYARLSYGALFKGFLGGASDWQAMNYDVRTYFRLTPDARHKLAFWAWGEWVIAGTAPYLDLPATGMDPYGRSGRGYPQGRFRGEQLVYGEVEYRWTAKKNGLFGMVAFLNTQTFGGEQSGGELFDSFATGGGVGVRLMLNKKSQTNLCFDIGWGREGKAVYFAVQEAF